MTDLLRIGPVYDLLGIRLQDVDGGCGSCGKRLAEVIEDTTSQWNRGDIVCINCGERANLAPYEIRSSWKVPGKRVAACQLCSYVSLPTDGDRAAQFALQHLAAAHG